MPRIPYVANDIAGPPELVAEIRSRRRHGLLNLDRMLLHSPALARGWNAYLGAVRSNLTVAPKLRELAICAVAVLNEADYELAQHLPEYISAGGSEAAAKALHEPADACENVMLFDLAERSVLRLTLEMTRQVQVSDATFAQVRSVFASDKQVVELVAIVATYNMVSRFLEALEVSIEGEGAHGLSDKA